MTYDRMSNMKREKATPHAFRVTPSEWADVVRLQQRIIAATGEKVTTTDVIRYALRTFVQSETRLLDQEEERQRAS